MTTNAKWFCQFLGEALVLALVVSPSRAQLIAGIRYVPAEACDVTACLAFSPDGGELLDCNDYGPVEIFKPPLGQKLGQFFARKFLSGLAFSPKGDVVAGYCEDRDDVFLLRTRDWKPLPPLRTPNRGVTSIDLSPDGTYLLAVCNDATLLLWDFPSRRLIREMKWPGDNSRTMLAHFSPDSKMLVTAGERVELWNVRTGARTISMRRTQSQGPKIQSVTCVAFRPDGGALFTAEECGALTDVIRMWNTSTGDLVGTFRWERSVAMSTVTALIPLSGGFLVSAGFFEGTLRLWDTRSTKELARFPTGANITCVTLSPDGRILACIMGCRDLRIWKISDVFPVVKPTERGVASDTKETARKRKGPGSLYLDRIAEKNVVSGHAATTASPPEKDKRGSRVYWVRHGNAAAR
jgi:WD40 repeat protein